MHKGGYNENHFKHFTLVLFMICRATQLMPRALCPLWSHNRCANFKALLCFFCRNLRCSLFQTITELEKLLPRWPNPHYSIQVLLLLL